MNRAPVVGDGVRLRPFRPDDAADVTAACADPTIQRFIPSMPDPYTGATARWWIAEGSEAAWAAGGASYAIADPDTDRLLGGIGLGAVVPDRQQGEIGYWVAPWARRRGVATAAARALTDRALTDGFARLELLTDLENLASQRVALAAGFRREGVRRAAAPRRDGGRRDLVVWVRLVGDPSGPTPRVLPDLPGGVLTDGVVTLRPLAPDDAGFLHGLHSRPEVAAVRVPPAAPDRAAVDRRCRAAGATWLAGEGADLVVVDTATGEPIGGCALAGVDPVTGQAGIGYSLLPAWRGRGYGTRLVRLLAGWAFDAVGLDRLTAGTSPENVASRRVLEKAGFRREGILRGRLPAAEGGRADEVVYGLLRGDPPHPAGRGGSPRDPGLA